MSTNGEGEHGLLPRREPLDSVAIDEADFAALRGAGYTDEDAWDIGAIAAVFALSNRMANLIAMRPNDEFFAMGRVPRDVARASSRPWRYAA